MDRSTTFMILSLIGLGVFMQSLEMQNVVLTVACGTFTAVSFYNIFCGVK